MPDTDQSVSSTTKLNDLDSTGAAVAKRVSTAEQAQDICSRFIRDDIIRASRRLLVQGMFNGNAQKSKQQMVTAGRGEESNLNWKEFEGHIINAWTPFFDLRCEVPLCADMDLELGDPAQDADLARGFAEYFHELVFGWRGFDDSCQLCDMQMLLHGNGILAWQDEWTWFPAPILASNFYVPDETLSSMENAEMVMFTQPITAGQLWRKIEDPKAAEAAGWNPDAVRAAIMDSGNSDAIQAYGKIWDRWEQAFKNGDLYISQQQTKQIKLATLFVQEMDGSISQMIVPQQPGGSTLNAGKAGKTKFLYYAGNSDDGKKKSKYQSWDQVLCVFPYDNGADGTFHSIKGMGTKIYPFCLLLNNVKNELANLVVTGIRPMWQPSTGGDLEKWKLVKIAGGNLVPNGLNVLDAKIGSNLEPALAISNEFSKTLTQNTGAYQQQDLSAPTVEETAKSAMIRAAERSKLTKGSYNRYMRCVTREYAEMFRRASNPELTANHPNSKEALNFQKCCRQLCEKMGVPWEWDRTAEDSPTGKAGKFTVLQLVTNVRANQSLGLGSAAMRIEIANQLMQNIDRFDEIGQNEILRMWTAVMTSYHGVDAIVPSLTQGRENVNDQSDAANEDNGFDILGPDAEAFVVPGQNHVIHLSVHIPSMQKDQQAWQAGQLDPQECFKRVEGKAMHANQHLQALQKNPTRQKEAKMFGQALQQIAALQDQLQQQLDQAAHAQAQQPQPGQPDPDVMKAQASIQLKQEKAAADHELKQQKSAADQQLKIQEQQFEQALKEQQLRMNGAMQAAEAAFKQRISDLEAAANQHRQNALVVAKARNGT